jgi:hypothetical protein
LEGYASCAWRNTLETVNEDPNFSVGLEPCAARAIALCQRAGGPPSCGRPLSARPAANNEEHGEERCGAQGHGRLASGVPGLCAIVR